MIQRLLTVLLGFLIASSTSAATFKLSDGSVITGEPVGFSSRGLVLKQPDGSYSSATAWESFSQETLKELRDNPKAVRFVQPLIQLTEEERQRLSGLTLSEVSRLDRPAGRTGIIGMLFSSGVGWFLVLLIYFGNLFAAYEVALYRAYSPQVVCGVAAVLPWISQAALLAIPRSVLVGAMGGKQVSENTAPPPPPAEEELERVPEEVAPDDPNAVLPPGELFEEAPLPPETQSPLLPDTITFSRGVVTFNRRFFETKLAKFTKSVLPEDVRDMNLFFKTSRGNHLTTYIAKLDQTELQIRVKKGDASEIVTVPYLEIYEVRLKHKDVS